MTLYTRRAILLTALLCLGDSLFFHMHLYHSPSFFEVLNVHFPILSVDQASCFVSLGGRGVSSIGGSSLLFVHVCTVDEKWSGKTPCDAACG